VSSFFQALVAELGQALDDPEVEFLAGESERSRHGNRLSRVVWVWRGGKLSPSTRTRSREGPDVIHPIYDDLATVDAYLRAPGDEALEQLWTRVLTLVRQRLGTASQPGEYVFLPSQGQSVSGRTDAREVMQRFQWRLSVREQSFGAATPVAILGFDTSYALTPR
jgi:hypothetical protein